MSMDHFSTSLLKGDFEVVKEQKKRDEIVGSRKSRDESRIGSSSYRGAAILNEFLIFLQTFTIY